VSKFGSTFVLTVGSLGSVDYSDVVVAAGITERVSIKTGVEDFNIHALELSGFLGNLVAGFFRSFGEVVNELLGVAVVGGQVQFSLNGFVDHLLFEFLLSSFFFFQHLFLGSLHFLVFVFLGFFENLLGLFEDVLLGFSLFSFDQEFGLDFFFGSFSHKQFFKSDFFFLELVSFFLEFLLFFFGFSSFFQGELLGFFNDIFEVFNSVLELLIFLFVFLAEFVGNFVVVLLFFNEFSLFFVFLIKNLLFSNFQLLFQRQLLEFFNDFLSTVVEFRNGRSPFFIGFRRRSTKSKEGRKIGIFRVDGAVKDVVGIGEHQLEAVLGTEGVNDHGGLDLFDVHGFYEGVDVFVFKQRQDLFVENGEDGSAVEEDGQVIVGVFEFLGSVNGSDLSKVALLDVAGVGVLDFLRRSGLFQVGL